MVQATPSPVELVLRLNGKAVEMDRRNRRGPHKAGRIFLAANGSSIKRPGGNRCRERSDGGQPPATAEVEIGHATEVNVVSPVAPDQQEIQRRRELVRALFNDFWNGRNDKPVTFVDRLNQAETYLNEQLTARGEPWQLDAKTRKMLGLPPRLN